MPPTVTCTHNLTNVGLRSSGTNVYLVGQKPPYILIDTGEGVPSFLPVLEDALRRNHRLQLGPDALSQHVMVDNTKEVSPVPCISDIIITHHHHDHYSGLNGVLLLAKKLWEECCQESVRVLNDDAPSEEEDSVASTYTPPKVHKLAAPPSRSTTPRTSADAAHVDNNLEGKIQAVFASLVAGTFSPLSNTESVHPLIPFQTLHTADGSSSLSVIHTPGHTSDSIFLYLHEEQTLFSADSILGQGTAVFEDLAAYMSSLRRIIALPDEKGPEWDFKMIYPGHGPVIEDGPTVIKTYIKHRAQREMEIISVLEKTSRSSEPEGIGRHDWTVKQLVAVIYKDYPERLWEPAAHGVILHLRKLEAEKQVQQLGGDGVQSSWILTSKL